MDVLSQPWMYYCVIPALGFYAFVMMQWIIVFAPLLVPIVVVIKAFRSTKILPP